MTNARWRPSRAGITNRGLSGQMQDRSMQREHLLARRRADEERGTAARSELLAAAGSDGGLLDGTLPPERALAALQRLLGPAVAVIGPGRAKGETESDGLRCVVERRPGESTTLRTPAGSLRLLDLPEPDPPSILVGGGSRIRRRSSSGRASLLV